MSLYVVLATGEVPHEITPVHEVQLIGKEIAQVLAKGRLHHRRGLATSVELDRRTLYLRPFLVGVDVVRVATEHTGEEHVQLVHVLIFRLITGDIITILLVLVLLDDTAPGRLALLADRHAHAILVLAFNLRDVGLSVDQWCLTILLAGQISTQGEDIARRVLVHRRIRRRANQRQRVRGITDHDHHERDQDRIHQLERQIALAGEEICRQERRQDYRHHVTATDERDTQQDDREKERDLQTDRMDLVAHGLPNGPEQNRRQDNDKDENARVVGHTQRIDEEELEIAADLHQALYHAIHHQSNDSERHQEGTDRPLHRRVREFLIVINQYDGRDTQQVQQVNTDTQAHQVGDQDNPAIRVWLVGHLLPFQDKPEDTSREEGRIGIYLALDGTEPEGVAKGIGQRAYQTATHDRDHLSHRNRLDILDHDATGQVSDAPEKEQDRQATEQGRHRVDHHRHLRGIGRELREQVGG